MANTPSVRTPFYKIIVDYKELSEDIYRKITKVTFKEPEDGEQYFEISMADQDCSIMDGGLFVADKTVCSLYMGYLDDYDLMMDGIVQVIATDFPKGDAPSLTVTVKNISSVMNREERNVRYIEKTYSDIVIDIAKRYGLKYDVDDTRYLFNPQPQAKSEVQTQPAEAELKVGATAHLKGYLYATSYGEGRGQYRDQDVTISRIVDTSRACPYLVNSVLGWVRRADLTPKSSDGSTPPVTTEDTDPVVTKAVYQTGKSDYEFCRAMANQIGFKFYIDCATLYFKKQIVTSDITLEYRVGEQNLISFRPNINTTNTKNKYKAANIDFNKDDVANEGTQTGAQSATGDEKSAGKQTYVVQSGDYLIKIAKKFYGDGSRYIDIYKANPDKVKMPNYVIYTGTTLVIP